jgi:hypothetical protein
MALKNELVTDFTLGQISDRYAGAVHLELRRKGAELIQGFVLNDDGGVSRRPGSVFVRDGLGITPTTNKLYDVQGNPSFLIFRFASDRYIGFIKDEGSQVSFQGEKVATGSQIMSLAHGSLTTQYHGVPLHQLRFYDPGTAKQWLHIWFESLGFDINLTSLAMSLADFQQAILYQGRLIAIDQSTGYILLSEELDYFDMVNDETATRPLTLVAEFSGRDDLKWIAARKSVYVGTDEGEWEVYSSYPFFSSELGGLIAREIENIGSDQAIYFGPNLVLRDLDRVIAMLPVAEEEYGAGGISERIDNGQLVQQTMNEFGEYRYYHALDVDGNLYSFLQSPGAQISGWVTLDTDVGWIFSYNKDLYVAKERDGDYVVEVYPLRELHHPGDRTLRDHSVFAANDAHGDVGGFLTLTGASLVGDLLPPSTMVDLYKVDVTNKTSTFLAATLTDSGGALADSLAGIKSLVGYDSGTWYLHGHQDGIYPAGTIRTLPLRDLLGETGSIARVILQVSDSSGASVRITNVDEDGVALAGGWETKETASLETKAWEFRPDSPMGTEPRIEIATLDYNPLNIHQVRVVIDTTGG